MIHRFKKLFLVGIIIFIFFPFKIKAEGASLYFSPGAGTFFVGSTFDISIFLNTNNENVNAVQVDVQFDPKKLQVASPTSGKSFIEVWISQPIFSNTKGTMTFIGGIPSPGINTSSGLLSTITFRAIAPGETTISFLASSKVLRNDAEGTNILTSLSRGVYNIAIPPPEGPKVFSSTHPDQNKWYKDNNPTFSWEKEIGVTDFSYTLNKDPQFTPDSVSEGNENSVSYSDIGDGIWYFHVKAKKGNIWGGTSHYLVEIDNTSPAVFSLDIKPSENTTEKQPLVSFFTTDSLSGTSYYQIKYIDVTSGKGEEGSSFFVEATSPYKLPVLASGNYMVIVRAYDVSGNWREGITKIQIFPGKFFVNKRGVQIFNFMIYWWVLILILILAAATLFIFLWFKNKNLKRKLKNDNLSSQIKDY